MSDMAQWLASLNLAQYAEASENDAIEIDLLPEITDDDLKALGVVALGHRKRILKAITALSPEPESSPGPTSRSTPSTDSQLQSPSAAQPAVSQAERRQLTVMFCDLVGSVALAEQMDVEDYRDLLTGFRNAVVSQIEAAHGFVAKHLGDGILAYFG
jgi:class 3 adenylate cyclase